MKRLIQTASEYIPIIYAYTIPNYPQKDGWTKIGETCKDANKRIDQQLSTADISYQLEWKVNAKYEASNIVFHDRDFHAYLQKLGYERGTRTNADGKQRETEWFRIPPDEARRMKMNIRNFSGTQSLVSERR